MLSCGSNYNWEYYESEAFSILLCSSAKWKAIIVNKIQFVKNNNVNLKFESNTIIVITPADWTCLIMGESSDPRLDFIQDFTLKSLRLKPDKWARMVVSDEQVTFTRNIFP